MFLLLDIGGTKMRIAHVDDQSHLKQIEKVATPDSIAKASSFVSEYILNNDLVGELQGVGVGFAGTLDTKKETIIKSPHIQTWEGENLCMHIQQHAQAPVFIENDTAVVGLGEVHHGAGKNASIVVYLTLSTGVGGARIVDGEIDENAFGFEPGHHIVDFTKTQVTLGSYTITPQTGEFEEYIAGSSVEKCTGKQPTEVKDKVFWDELAKIAAMGLYNISLFWSPEVIVLGGGMIIHDAIDFESVTKYFNEKLELFAKDPILKKAELEDNGGLYGALTLVKQKL